MKTLKFVVAIISVVVLSVGNMSAQKYKWTKYYLEMGFLGGGSFYLGDANDQIFKNTRPTAGMFLKYKHNGHWETKMQLTAGQAGIGTFEDKDHKPYERITTFGDLSVIAEFNFFNYGAMQLEQGAAKVSPYIFAGLGVSYFNKGLAPIMPFGIGAKWKMSNRTNLGIYWSMQKTLWNDNFDLIDNPLELKKTMWNNNDWYSTCAIYFSFDFLEICPSCSDGRRTYFYQGY